jgi:hypothetical protein
MTMATLVDTTALWQTVVGSLVAGIGVTFAFSVAIFGASRSVELGRDGHSVAASLFGALAVAGLLAVAGAVVLGVIVMTSK